MIEENKLITKLVERIETEDLLTLAQQLPYGQVVQTTSIYRYNNFLDKNYNVFSNDEDTEDMENLSEIGVVSYNEEIFNVTSSEIDIDAIFSGNQSEAKEPDDESWRELLETAVKAGIKADILKFDELKSKFNTII
jgi:hypothetical protein